MSEITLKSGKVVKVDVSKLTVKEWRAFVAPGSNANDENIVIEKCTNLKTDEIGEMIYSDFKDVVREIITVAQSPLDNPN